VAEALVDGEVYGVDLSVASAGKIVEDDKGSESAHYPSDIFSEVERFTACVVERFRLQDFDVIHAHDWMTFPAAVALAKATNRPLIAHIHSLEHDRSGFFCDTTIDSIEKLGTTSANHVIAVSHYTKRSIELRHGVAPALISVVHNGVYPRQVVSDYRHKKTGPKHVVLFLGRVTFQKGPDYFVEVATRVVPHVKDVVFVLAGTGDMLPTIVEEVRNRSLDQYFLFPGFVQGAELEELFSVADLYVMPSVSEPFGIAALEAISFDTPVLLSKQSGASEVLRHVLKSDFWDTERMADLIINALLHPELRAELAVHAKGEISALHWDIAAQKTVAIYQEFLSQRLSAC
jgi:glycosyltransferase involved in cell wall biosynthesis